MKKLKWGQTPFDRMTKKELTENAIRMYDALIASRSCLKILRANDTSIYWQSDGSGGRALNKADQTIEHIHKNFDDEQIYRMFYRYANNLIFTDLDKMDWYICDKDGSMYSPGNIECLQCKGKLRKITMKDLDRKDFESA
jgi:hypothetical protein